MTKYKFRAECILDVLAFRKRAFGRIKDLTVVFHDRFPDVTVTVESEEGQQDLEAILANIEDGHVMFESFNTEKDYTGERVEKRR